IFGGDDSLNFAELSQRVEAVVVYSHFAALLPRYMQKKELETLSRDQCAKLIARADEKITANYSPLNWAQTIDPLFKLLDEGVDPSLLRLFFEDKERSNIAEAFEQKDEKLSRAEFIETLTAPDLLDSPAAVPEGLPEKEEQAEDTSDSTSEQPEHSEMNEETEEEEGSAKTEASALALDQEEDQKDEQEQREAPEPASDNSGAESSADEQDSGWNADVTEKDQDQSSGQPEEDDSPEVEVYVESGDVSADENDSLNAAFNDW